jgi:addiction module HigA family antidote
VTVAQAVQRQLDRKGWTQEEAAAELGVSRYSVNQLVNGRRSITPDMALRLEKVFGVSAESWLALQAKQDLEEARE